MSRVEKLVLFGSFLGLVAALFFATGFYWRHAWVWPARDVVILQEQFREWRATGRWGRGNQFIRSDVAAGDPRARILNAALFEPGYRVIMSYDVDMGTYSVRLLDAAGEQIHQWRASSAELGSLSIEEGDINPHGMEITPDGSVFLNFGGSGNLMVRLDACGAPVWTKQGAYHHSMHAAEDGTLWTWFSPDFINGQFQSIVQIDPATGETLTEIPMEDVVAHSDLNRLLLRIPEDFQFRKRADVPRWIEVDIFHPNDVEPLPESLADAFPQFEVGDLLVSLRNIDLVAVIDPDTLEIKWSQAGPWLWQHDPDFQPDGTITVYDNAYRRGRSDIIRVDPATGALSRVFGASAPRFYSATQGKHQVLPGGATLITVPGEGRIVELAPDGSVVFEYLNIVDDGLLGRTFNAQWLPLGFFDTLPSCPDA